MAAFKYPEALVREHIFSEKTAARTGKNIGVNEKQKHGRVRCAGYAGMQRLKQGSSALLFTHQHIFLFHLSYRMSLNSPYRYVCIMGEQGSLL